jgi:hypothetical protein
LMRQFLSLAIAFILRLAFFLKSMSSIQRLGPGFPYSHLAQMPLIRDSPRIIRRHLRHKTSGNLRKTMSASHPFTCQPHTDVGFSYDVLLLQLIQKAPLPYHSQDTGISPTT